MYACHTLNVGKATYRFQQDLFTLCPLVGSSLNPGKYVFWNVYARHVLGHPAQRLGRAQSADADNDRTMLMQLARANFPHEIGELLHVEAELRLNELRAGFDLHSKIVDAVAIRRSERVYRRAE